MKRALLAALALALLLPGVADAQDARPARMSETGWGAMGAPSGCTTGSLGIFLGSLTCVPGLTYAGGVLSVPGAVSARNFNAIPLPAAGAVTVTPTLSQVGGITVVAGAALADGDALSVGDGVGVVPIEFDASPGDGTTGGAVAIVFDGTETATQIRDAVKAILDGAGRDWTTSNQGADGIGLVRATPGATGGAITESVTAAGFLVTDWTNPTAATTYTYSLQACLADGTCNAAGAASTTTAGNATLSATNFNRLSWSAVTGAASYKIRRDVGGASTGVIWSGTALTVNDTGLAGDGTVKPVASMTGTVQAGNFKTDANGNSATGYNALYSNTTGIGNSATGCGALYSNTTGSYNSATGFDALHSNTTGNYNSATGFGALYSNTTGTGNSATGYESGYNTGATASTANAVTTSTNTTFLGYQSGLGSPTQRTNSTAIGANSYVDADNRVVLGDGNVVDVYAGSAAQARLVGTGVRLVTGSRPTCDATTRGLLWYVAGGAGVADTCEVCRKDAGDAYAWVSLF